VAARALARTEQRRVEVAGDGLELSARGAEARLPHELLVASLVEEVLPGRLGASRGHRS
jgi:hypothetical protein